MNKTYLYTLRDKLLDYLSEEYGKQRSPKGAQEVIRELVHSNLGMAHLSSMVLFSQPVACWILLEKLKEIGDHRQTILSMKDHRLPKNPTFVEIYHDLKADRPLSTFMVESMERDGGAGVEFVATFFPEDFPMTVAQLIVSPSDNDAPLKQQSAEGLVPVDFGDVESGDDFDLMLRALRAVMHPERFECLPGSLIADTDTEPTLVQELLDRLSQLNEGKIQCHEADVPLEMIQPSDPYFCLEYPSHAILTFKGELQKGKRPHLLVYWSGTDFVMADDYGNYLAYRLLQIDPVPCAILGDFQPKLPRVGKSGGWEVLPPVPVRRTPPPLRDIVCEDEIDRHIEHRLQQIDSFDRRLNFFPRLVEAASRLVFLLQKQDVQEKEVHRFLQNHPEVIDATASLTLSEVRLGGDYRIDMVLQHEIGSVKHTMLVELENPRHELFTKAGRPRACVTHAVQQVEDWIRWWREHPDSVPAPIVPEFPPSGLVIIGRSQNLSSKEESILEHLNSNRLVNVLTYDMILHRYETMLRSILAVQGFYGVNTQQRAQP